MTRFSIHLIFLISLQLDLALSRFARKQTFQKFVLVSHRLLHLITLPKKARHFCNQEKLSVHAKRCSFSVYVVAINRFHHMILPALLSELIAHPS